MLNEQEQRHVYYDRDLQIEAYNLSGIVQKFPNHFHDYYVIGFVEGGSRHLWCKGNEYDLTVGDLILFNPRDNHYCAPMNGEILDYRAVNINPDVMCRAVKEITGQSFSPTSPKNVVYGSDIPSLWETCTTLFSWMPRSLRRKSCFSFFWNKCFGNMQLPLRRHRSHSPLPRPRTCAGTWRNIFPKTSPWMTCCP